MIKFITLKILKIFDFYYQIKLFSFLKKNNHNSFDIFFDIGAHEGESILLFSKNLNLKRIYSFEASPKSYKKLLKKTEIIKNNFKNLEINLENLAVGEIKKRIEFKHLLESSSSTLNNINENSNYFKKKKFFLNFKEKILLKNLKLNKLS